MADLNFSLLPWQQEVFGDKSRFKIVAAGRRCGKSRLCAITLIIEALRCPPGSAVLYVSPTMGQSRQIIWDLLLDLGRDVIQASHVNNLDITMINGAKIYVRGADRPDTLRGVSLTYAVLDEVADIKPEAWEQVIRASLSDKKGRALFLGTPKGRNWFHDLYKLGESGDDPDWKSWHFTTADNPLIDPSEIESAKKTLSTFAFKQEFMASFSNAGSDVFKEEWVKFGERPNKGSFYISVDLAGFEEVAKQAGNAKKRLDESAICVVYVTEDGKWFVEKIIHGRWDIRTTAVNILMAIRDYKPLSIGIERGALKNAVLPYLSDLMRKSNIYAHIIDLTHGNRKKADRIIWALQGRFEHGRITLNSEENWDDFVDQLLMFPAQGVHDDLCFIANTQISTPTGLKSIAQLKVGDLVDTPEGARKVIAQSMTNANAQVYRLRNKLIGTGNHPIMTKRGWVNLQNIANDDILVHQHTGVSSWVFQVKLALSKSLFTLTDTSTTAIQNLRELLIKGTSPRVEVAYCTAISGSSITEKYQKDTIFTTRMGTFSTMTSQIWSVLSQKFTMPSTKKTEVGTQNVLNNLLIWTKLEKKPQSGMAHQKDLSGTVKPPKPLGKIEVLLRTLAKNVKTSFNLAKQQKSITARVSALLLRGERNFPTTIALKQRQSVYNLTIEGAHCYYANGILVHNCDALSYIDQLAVTSYFQEDEDDEWEPLDIISGV
jgi:hypothetical protein